MDGLLPLDKPEGMTSAHAVARVKRLLPRGVRVGHAGTLDKFATGLVVLLLGRATKRCEEVMGWTKTYQATVRLGATTPTLDPSSEPVPDSDAREVPLDRVNRALARWTGLVEQVPPLFSALKVGGKRASDRTRAGEVVRLEPRIIQVYRITLLRYAYPEVQIEVVCGRGTYVRALARDLACEMGTSGYLLALRRTQIGEIPVTRASRLEGLSMPLVEAGLHDLPAGD